MARRDPHGVDPSRATQHDNTSSYRAGRKDPTGPAKLRAANTGGIPPRKTGCPLKLLLLLALPVHLIRHLIGDPR